MPAHKPIRCVIIDDEPEALYIMEQLMQQIPGVVVVGTADNAAKGLEIAISQSPDLVFLDIQMPFMNGLELARELIQHDFSGHIVFATAHDDFAIEALRLSAFDYLLKPVDPDMLYRLFARIHVQEHSGRMVEKQLAMLLRHIQKDNRIRVNTRTGFILVEPKEVILVKAEGNYSRLRISGKKDELVSISIGQLENMLSDKIFFRASRSYLINLSYVCQFDRKKKSAFLEHKGESHCIAIAREKVSKFEECWV